MTALSSRSIPTGPGSRGGRWHEPEFRRQYRRAWKLAHPDYMERERLRKARRRAVARGEDPSLVGPADTGRRRGSLPAHYVMCQSCGTEMGRALCGFCSMGRTVRPPTRRQVECAEAAVRAMLEGRNQHDAAASLGLGYQTFRNHLRDARRRAGVTRTTQLARYFTGLA